MHNIKSSKWFKSNKLRRDEQLLEQQQLELKKQKLDFELLQINTQSVLKEQQLELEKQKLEFELFQINTQHSLEEQKQLFVTTQLSVFDNLTAQQQLLDLECQKLEDDKTVFERQKCDDERKKHEDNIKMLDKQKLDIQIAINEYTTLYDLDHAKQIQNLNDKIIEMNSTHAVQIQNLQHVIIDLRRQHAEQIQNLNNIITELNSHPLDKQKALDELITICNKKKNELESLIQKKLYEFESIIQRSIEQKLENQYQMFQSKFRNFERAIVQCTRELNETRAIHRHNLDKQTKEYEKKLYILQHDRKRLCQDKLYAQQIEQRILLNLTDNKQIFKIRGISFIMLKRGVGFDLNTKKEIKISEVFQHNVIMEHTGTIDNGSQLLRVILNTLYVIYDRTTVHKNYLVWKCINHICNKDISWNDNPNIKDEASQYKLFITELRTRAMKTMPLRHFVVIFKLMFNAVGNDINAYTTWLNGPSSGCLYNDHLNTNSISGPSYVLDEDVTIAILK